MPSTRHFSYDLNFKLKIVAEAEAVNNNREIAREYGISESMVRKWRKQQDVLFSGELKMTAKRASMGCYCPKDPELDQTLADWFSEQRSSKQIVKATTRRIQLPGFNSNNIKTVLFRTTISYKSQ